MLLIVYYFQCCILVKMERFIFKSYTLIPNIIFLYPFLKMRIEFLNSDASSHCTFPRTQSTSQRAWESCPVGIWPLSFLKSARCAGSGPPRHRYQDPRWDSVCKSMYGKKHYNIKKKKKKFFIRERVDLTLVQMYSQCRRKERKGWMKVSHTPKYLILYVAMVNGIVSLISLSVFPLLVYRNARDSSVLILYPETLLYSALVIFW